MSVTLEFQHNPLQDAAAQIRLLQLLPAQQRDAQLEFEVKLYDIKEAPAYHAISYHWGESAPLRTITVNGHSFHVRENCYYALWQFRLHFPESKLWIDSVCIDQLDVAEKSGQVQIMGNIFRQATIVAASVGPHANGSEAVCQIKRPLGSNKQKALETPMVAFAQRPYWSRLWIIQELYLAKYIWILCGEDAIKNWKETHCRLFFHHLRRELAPFNVLMEQKNHKQRVFEIEHAVKIFRDFECHEPRDHVYGLLALCDRQQHTIEVDYSVPLPLLALEVARLSTNIDHFFSRIALLLRILGISAPILIETSLGFSRPKEIANSWPQFAETILARLSQVRRAELVMNGHVPSFRSDFPGWFSKIVWHKQKLELNHRGYLTCKIIKEDNYGDDKKDILATERPGGDRIEEKIQTRPLLHEGQPVGYLGTDAQAGDVLLSPFPSSILQRDPPLLIAVRHSHGDFYYLVGQGILCHGYNLPDTFTGRPGSQYSSPEANVEGVKSWLVMHEVEAFLMIANHWLNVSTLGQNASTGALYFDNLLLSMTSFAFLEVE